MVTFDWFIWKTGRSSFCFKWKPNLNPGKGEKQIATGSNLGKEVKQCVNDVGKLTENRNIKNYSNSTPGEVGEARVE